MTGYEHLPKEGSYVIATNHLGIMDAPMAFYALDRWDMFVMVGGEVGKRSTVFRWLGKYFNFIFIDRFNPDIKTLRKVIKLMEEDNILVIAPEGTRSRAGSLIEAKPGVSYLATKLNRPIVPVALAGTEDEGVVRQPETPEARRGLPSPPGPGFTTPPLPKENRDEEVLVVVGVFVLTLAIRKLNEV
ncbi:MAG: 1-acyl-sn-glycerol-3-phosphate acyltransferase, partial [Rhodopseudomonas palustris]|nr:1-acyl-sn-glycerol-3-phosphate acyltransferase [Rhodopseudomonas palustris]